MAYESLIRPTKVYNRFLYFTILFFIIIKYVDMKKYKNFLSKTLFNILNIISNKFFIYLFFCFYNRDE